MTALRAPTATDLRRVAKNCGLSLTTAELERYATLAPDLFDLLGILDDVVTEDSAFNTDAVRTVGSRSPPTEDPFNAIAVRCSVSTGRIGKLAGRRIGLKDNISVAGVPMTCSSRILAGYVPDADATVVTRLLDEGAEIVAMLNCDDMAWSSRGQSSAFGPILNPHDTSRLAGGSSGGSAAALFYDDIDLTLGCDQGGSIRIPASWSGVVGLRPTFGLVPYTGILAGETTLDCVGPMARSVEDVALLLGVVAGKDASDPRQRDIDIPDYVSALSGDVTGYRVGVVTEGFEHPTAERSVNETVMRAIHRLGGQGLNVAEVSIPLHSRIAYAVQQGIDYEGGAAVLRGHGLGYGWQGFYQESLGTALGNRLKTNADDLSAEAKLMLLFGTFLSDEHQGRIYARAQNLRRVTRAEYDRALETFQVLALPTVPMRAHVLDSHIDWLQRISRESGMGANTAPFSATGHPCVSVPCGTVDGLPIGVMLVGKHFDEATVLQVAQAIENSVSDEH